MKYEIDEDTERPIVVPFHFNKTLEVPHKIPEDVMAVIEYEGTGFGLMSLTRLNFNPLFGSNYQQSFSRRCAKLSPKLIRENNILSNKKMTIILNSGNCI